MEIQPIRSYYLALLGAASASLDALAINPATAGEAAYCLACTGPSQTYLCRVTGEGVSQNDIFRLYCIVRTARRSGHESCAATGSSENCNGMVRNFKYRGSSLSASLAENPKVKRFINKVEEDYSAPKTSATTRTGALPSQVNSNSPRRSMLQRMGHAAQNAGAALGGFAQGSYRCLRSLFRKCRGDRGSTPTVTISQP
jgi:hypothetical protein